MYFANQIYKPSYISLHTALKFHGVIPEEVVQFTSVSTLKTAIFQNVFGTYTYHHISTNYMFGYELIRSDSPTQFVIQMATPEKAIIDLLHLYPEYNTINDMLNLRLDNDFMASNFDQKRMLDFERRILSPALSKRILLLREAYDLL